MIPVPDAPFAPTPPSPPSLELPPSCPPMAYLSRPISTPEMDMDTAIDMATRQRLWDLENQVSKTKYNGNNNNRKFPALFCCYAGILAVLVGLAAIYFILFGRIFK